MTRTFAPSSEFFQHTETGAGGGTGGGQASAGGGGATAPSGGQAPVGGGGGSGGATPITLTPDSMVIPPGSTTPIKYSEYMSGHVPRQQLDTVGTQAVQNFLRTLVAAKGKARPGQGQGQQHQAQHQRQQPTDFFADVKGLPLVDGQTLASLGERIQREGIQPLYEWAGQINQYLQAVNGQLQTMGRATGSLAEERSRTEFSGKMDKAIASLTKEVFPGVNANEHPILRDIAEDVYLSHDPNDPNLEREFAGMLKSRMEGLLKLAGALNQAKLQTARETRRNFLKPGGQGHPSGNGQGQRLSHRDIARNMFANDASRT